MERVIVVGRRCDLASQCGSTGPADVVFGCGSLSVCVPSGTVDEAWLKKGLPCS